MGEKENKKFLKELIKSRKEMTKLLNPRICYTSDYDIFSIIWGDKKVDSTIETNLISQGDLRFDMTKEGIVVGIEIENFTEVLKKFDCDKKNGKKKSA
jgi:uncharacterized protein YuzE